MFYGNTNVNAETGIRFTVYSGNKLNQGVFDDLFHHCGVNLSEEAALEELQREINSDADDIEDECRIALEEAGGLTADEFEHLLEQNIEAAYERLGYQHRGDYVSTRMERESDFQIDEPIIEGHDDDVSYQITWLGGAPLVWVLKSPHLGKFRLCSPCVPNACDGDNPTEDGYEGYAAPASWFNED